MSSKLSSPSMSSYILFSPQSNVNGSNSMIFEYLSVFTPTYARSTKAACRSACGSMLLSVDGYSVKGTLGKGSFGVVYRVICDKDKEKGKHYAMKELCTNKRTCHLYRNGACPPELLKEISIMKKLKHKNLVKLKEFIQETESPYTIFMVMEYLKLGNIMSKDPNNPGRYICPLTGSVMGEAVASKCFREICDGMVYLHSHCIAHRDLKIENILLDVDGSVRIADFGVSRIFNCKLSDGNVSDVQGTPSFYAPEICDQNRTEYSAYKADVWAAGVCLWVFKYGTMPFPASIFYDTNEFKTAVQPYRVSAELENLLQSLLSRDPDLRPSFVDCLQSDFIQLHKFEDPFTGLNLSFVSSKKSQSTPMTDGNFDFERSFRQNTLSLSSKSMANMQQWIDRAKLNASRRKEICIEEATAAEIESERQMVRRLEIFSGENESVKDNYFVPSAERTEVASTNCTFCGCGIS